MRTSFTKLTDWLTRNIDFSEIQSRIQKNQDDWKSRVENKQVGFSQKLRNTAEELGYYYRWLNNLTGGFLAALRRALKTFADARAPEAAASLSYYAIFSLFPLLLAAVVAGGFFLKREVIKNQLITLIMDFLPTFSQDFIIQNVQRVVDYRGSFGVIALATLLWSGSNVFHLLFVNIDRAWPKQNRAGIIKRRAMALSIIIGLILLFILSITSTALFGFIPKIKLPAIEELKFLETFFWDVSAFIVPILFKFLILYSLYSWVPTVRLYWKTTLWGALVVAVIWETVTDGFTWLMSSGLNRYELIYGSLGVIVSLMLWIFWSSWIILFGAHLTAAFHEWQRTAHQQSKKKLA